MGKKAGERLCFKKDWKCFLSLSKAPVQSYGIETGVSNGLRQGSSHLLLLI